MNSAVLVILTLLVFVAILLAVVLRRWNADRRSPANQNSHLPPRPRAEPPLAAAPRRPVPRQTRERPTRVAPVTVDLERGMVNGVQVIADGPREAAAAGTVARSRQVTGTPRVARPSHWILAPGSVEGTRTNGYEGGAD